MGMIFQVILHKKIRRKSLVLLEKSHTPGGNCYKR